jgi:hypothetical protein
LVATGIVLNLSFLNYDYMVAENGNNESGKGSALVTQEDNDAVSKTGGSADDNGFHNSQLADELIEQEAEVSDHSNAGDLDVKDTTEPAPPGTPKSIANEAEDDA